MPTNGISGNGTRLRHKEELLPSRNGGSCPNEPEQETCTKDFPKGIIFGVVTAAALVVILLTTSFLILKKKPDFLNSIVGKSNLDAREMEPVDSTHTQGQDEGNYNQRGEDYYDKNNYDQRGEDYYYKNNYDQRGGEDYYDQGEEYNYY